jgi:hypothetical protein
VALVVNTIVNIGFGEYKNRPPRMACFVCDRRCVPFGAAVIEERPRGQNLAGLAGAIGPSQIL